jgi:GxxExxY protein
MYTQTELIDIFYKVANCLGKGYHENIYKETICVDLRQSKINYSKEVNIPIRYNNSTIGCIRADIIIEHVIDYQTIIECKAIDTNLKVNHIPQLLNYLKKTNCKNGYLVNFNQNVSKPIFPTCKHNLQTQLQYYNIDTLGRNTVNILIL